MVLMVLDDEVSGTITGGPRPSGSAAPSRARRSETSWRARNRSASSAKIKLTTDRPWIDCERIAVSRARPPSAVSIGRVISTSVSSADRPGASVWMITSLGENSGKMSRLAVVSR